MKNSAVAIGNSVYHGRKRPIYFQDQDRLRHMYMVGKTGVGKSSVFQNMCLEDIRNGRGVCFMDPHGDSIDWLEARIPASRLTDVILFDPSDADFPFGLNLLEASSEHERDFLVAECIQIFYKLFDPQKTGFIGPQFEHWLRNAALTIMADPEGGSLIEIPRLFVDRDFERSKIKHLTDPLVLEFWTKQMARTSDFHRSEMLNYFMSKFGHFMNNSLMRNIIGQYHSSFTFDDAIANNKIVLINLSKGKIGEINTHMLGLILVAKLQITILKRVHATAENREPFYLYVDEFQNFVTETFISMLSESRKYGLGVHLANQYLYQLPKELLEAVIGNVGTFLAFEIGAEDASFLEKEFDPIDVQDFMSLKRFNFYIKLMVDGKTTMPFKGESLMPDESVSAIEIKQVMGAFNRLAYGSPRMLVDQNIRERLR